MEGVEIAFAADMGFVSPITAATDANGVATTTFTAGDSPGMTTITASVQGLEMSSSLPLVILISLPADASRIFLPLVTVD